MAASDDKQAMACLTLIGCAIMAAMAVIFIVATVWKVWFG